MFGQLRNVLNACRHGERHHPAEPGGRVSFHSSHHDLQGKLYTATEGKNADNKALMTQQ